MFCRDCGKKTSNASKFCAHCGKAVFPNEKAPNGSPNKKTKNQTGLKVLEVFLWIGVALILFNLSFEEIDWWLIIGSETVLLFGLAYIKGWIKNFEIPLVLLLLGLAINVVIFSPLDAALYGLGVYGVIIKKKSYETRTS